MYLHQGTPTCPPAPAMPDSTICPDGFAWGPTAIVTSDGCIVGWDYGCISPGNGGFICPPAPEMPTSCPGGTILPIYDSNRCLRGWTCVATTEIPTAYDVIAARPIDYFDNIYGVKWGALPGGTQTCILTAFDSLIGSLVATGSENIIAEVLQWGSVNLATFCPYSTPEPEPEPMPVCQRCDPPSAPVLQATEQWVLVDPANCRWSIERDGQFSAPYTGVCLPGPPAIPPPLTTWTGGGGAAPGRPVVTAATGGTGWLETLQRFYRDNPTLVLVGATAVGVWWFTRRKRK